MKYEPLPALKLTDSARVYQPAKPKQVTLNSPAFKVMTDLRHISAAVIESNVAIEFANIYMIHRGVRLLFVLNQNGILEGIITATDILGEKPLRFTQERQVKHSEILVSDIMTPFDKLEAIPLEEIVRAKVGNVIASLRESGRQHNLVTENSIDGLLTICGIFSLTQIEKQLGKTIPISEVAKTFSEIETSLST